MTLHQATLPYAVVAAAISRGFDLQTQRSGCGHAGRCSRLPLTRQYSQNHIAAGDVHRQRFGTGCLDRLQSMVEHRAQHFDELAIGIGMRLQLRAHLSQAGR
jgi:hypothetical protein